MNYTLVAPAVNTDVLAFAGHVADVSITATWPEGWDFEDASITESNCDRSGNSVTWVYKGGLVKNEHLRGIWRKKDPTTPGTG